MDCRLNESFDVYDVDDWYFVSQDSSNASQAAVVGKTTNTEGMLRSCFSWDESLGGVDKDAKTVDFLGPELHFMGDLGVSAPSRRTDAAMQGIFSPTEEGVCMSDDHLFSSSSLHNTGDLGLASLPLTAQSQQVSILVKPPVFDHPRPIEGTFNIAISPDNAPTVDDLRFKIKQGALHTSGLSPVELIITKVIAVWEWEGEDEEWTYTSINDKNVGNVMN
ncbi:MAG: hypothetical protein M1831_007418 [Alyxoria varia]|nr:MAG: hypothetical protein M1831_007418 [Alyxoria varia]